MKVIPHQISSFFFLLLLSNFLFVSCHHTQNKTSNLSNGKDSLAVLSPDSIESRIKFYTGKIETNSKDADAYWNRGKLESQSAEQERNPGKLGPALADLSIAVQLDSTKSDYYFNLAKVEFNTGRTHEARDAFLTSIRLNSKNTDAILQLAELYIYVKKYQESLDLIETAIKINPNIAHEYFMKGVIFLDRNDTAKAISSFQTATEQDPDYYDAYIKLGLIFSHKGNPIALTYFNNAMKVQPENPESYYDAGMFYQFGQDYTDAIKTYNELVQLDSLHNLSDTLHKHAYYNLGIIYYLGKSRFDSALSCFDKVISSDSSNYLAYFCRANCYLQLKNKNKALADFAHACQINPNFKDAKESYNELKNKKI